MKYEKIYYWFIKLMLKKISQISQFVKSLWRNSTENEEFVCRIRYLRKVEKNGRPTVRNERKS